MRTQQRDNRFALPGHYMGLHWDGGWWFVQVLGTSQLELKPWILLNENDNRAAISANTAGNQDEIQDSSSRRLLEPNDSERNLIWQILVGASPSRMQIFPLFGRDQNLGLENSIATGEDEYWITGFDSPYNNPSPQSEVLYVNDMKSLKLQAFNPMDEAQEARLSFHINKVRYATVTDIDMMKAMLQGQIPASKHMMGLGAQDRHQLKPPEWLKDTFGEHIHTSEEIMNQGDSSNANTAGASVQVGDAARLEGQT